MGQALIRNIDDEVLDAYRLAAKAHGRSLEAELREALRRAKPETRRNADELKALSTRLRAMTPHDALEGDSWQVIRWHRDTNGGRWTDDGWADATGR